jgi:hypothetical protein
MKLYSDGEVGKEITIKYEPSFHGYVVYKDHKPIGELRSLHRGFSVYRYTDKGKDYAGKMTEQEAMVFLQGTE